MKPNTPAIVPARGRSKGHKSKKKYKITGRANALRYNLSFDANDPNG